MHVTDSQDTFKHIRLFFGVRLMKHTLVAIAGGAGACSCIHGDEDELFRQPFLYLGKTVGIIADSVLIIGRTGTDD